MNLKTYLAQEKGRAEVLARHLGFGSAYLRQICSGIRKPSSKLCVRIEVATLRAVTRQDLRPDDWHEIWPELARKKSVKSH